MFRLRRLVARPHRAGAPGVALVGLIVLAMACASPPTTVSSSAGTPTEGKGSADSSISTSTSPPRLHKDLHPRRLPPRHGRPAPDHRLWRGRPVRRVPSGRHRRCVDPLGGGRDSPGPDPAQFRGRGARETHRGVSQGSSGQRAGAQLPAVLHHRRS